jgi:FtsP/CotA-like multicopper oxidase with cupredoxin domain
MRVLLAFLLIFLSAPAIAKKIHYDLTATRQKINLSGKAEVDFAISINGSIPAPTLEFTEGDDAEITVINNIADEELSIHWHGILLPPEMDGVPYVTTPPIRPGEFFTFKFKLRQNGTYWYHSHTSVQEQKGVYGAFIIHPKKETIKADKEVVAVLSDWSDENPHQILANLRKDGDYYLYKKDTVRSYADALQKKSLKNYLTNEWQRMGGMDLSDVGYDAFLINGKQNHQLIDAKPGQKVRLRIINAAASTYFHVALAGTKMKIIAVDGVDIEPTEANEFLMALAETYDLLFTVPADKNYELRATAQDGTGSTSGWVGNSKGEKVSSAAMALPDPYELMNHDHAKMDHSKMSHADMMKMMKPSPFSVDDIKAKQKTIFPEKPARYDVKLVLNGDMSRYIWHINNKAIHEERTLEIKEGDIVRFTFENQSMMHHPMHLHGHFFRVLNKFGDFSPMKHTVDVPPHRTRTIEFIANEPGEWMLHCHNLYHMKTGMARVVKYSSFTPKKEIADFQKEDPHLHDHSYYYGMLEAASNHAQAKFRASKTWDELDIRIEARQDFHWDGEGDFFYRRWTSQFFSFVFGGVNYGKEDRLIAGFSYTFPFLLKTNWLIDGRGKTRLDVERKFQWTKYIYTDMDFTFRQDSKMEFEVSLMYAADWNTSAGFKFTEDSTGIGIQYQF